MRRSRSRLFENNLLRQVVCFCSPFFFGMLVGCESTTRVAVQSLRSLGSAGVVAEPPSQSQFQYMRVSARGQVSFWALGYREPTAGDLQAAGKSLEVWYSGLGQVLQLVDGRIVASAGLPVDWRSARLQSPPEFSRLGADQSFTYRRVRDVMPGYHYGIEESVAVSVRAPGDGTLVVTEAATPLAAATAQALPAARFVLRPADPGGWETVESFQCLHADWCLHLARWVPAAERKRASAP